MAVSSISEQTSVVIPAMNEAVAIGRVVTALRASAAWREILVVDDGSTDATADVASAAGACVLRHPYNKGNGAAVKTAVRHASGRYVLIMDGDGQHLPSDALRLIGKLRDYDLVIGARSADSQASATRRTGNAVLNAIATYL